MPFGIDRASNGLLRLRAANRLARMLEATGARIRITHGSRVTCVHYDDGCRLLEQRIIEIEAGDDTELVPLGPLSGCVQRLLP